MNEVLFITIESVVLIGIYLVGTSLTWPLRQRTRALPSDQRGFVVFLRCIIAELSRPVAVIAETGLVLSVLDHHPSLQRWIHLPLNHVAAWCTFWSVFAALVFVEQLAVQFYRWMGRPFPVPELMRNIIRTVLLVAAAFAILRLMLGINISGLLASTALLTAVIGFALQGVLGNLLAGMSLHIVRSVMPGDWVTIGDVEGEVVQTNWRETRLRTVGGFTMILPNSTVASATIHNMTRPTTLRRHRTVVGASYSDAPGDVIQALVDAAMAVPEVIRNPAPTAYLSQYMDFGINYELRFWTNRYWDHVPLDGDVQRMIWYIFQRRGIEIPFPMSDKVLVDLAEVMNHQKRSPPGDADTQQTFADLVRSDFVSKMLVDEKGQRLLKDDDLRFIASSVGRVRFTRGETIFRQGEPGDTCYVVVWGRVHGRVEYKDAAQANEFDLGPGALFGEMSLATGLPRTATIVVNEEVELLEISADAFAQLLGLREDVPQALARLVSERSAQNAAAWEKLRAMGSNLADSLKRENILSRFLRMLGKGK